MVRSDVYPSLNLVAVFYEGSVTDQQIRDVFTHAARADGFTPGMNEFGDLSKVTKATFGFPEMVRLQQHLARHYRQCEAIARSAFFAPTGLVYGMARMYQSLVDANPCGLTVSVHRSEAEALRALGYAADSLSELITSS